jgi:hypothetical protein
MRYHLTTQVPDLLSPEAEVYDAIGAIGKIYYSAGECFVEGGVGVAEPGEAGGGP